MELSALNSSQQRPFQGYSQKAMGLLSMQTTLLISLPNSCKSLANQSIPLSSSTILSQSYCVRMCFILRVGSIRLITNSTQLRTPVEKMTGSHSSSKYDRKLSRFLRLQMLSRHSQSQNQRWKSSFLLGASMQPSSSGVKVYARTSSISITTVSLLGSLEGGNSLGFCLLFSMMLWARQALFFGLLEMGAMTVGSLFLLKKKLRVIGLSPFLIIRNKRQPNQNLIHIDIAASKTYSHLLALSLVHNLLSVNLNLISLLNKQGFRQELVDLLREQCLPYVQELYSNLNRSKKAV